MRQYVDLPTDVALLGMLDETMESIERVFHRKQTGGPCVKRILAVLARFLCVQGELYNSAKSSRQMYDV
jgi:hypothetical protein